MGLLPPIAQEDMMEKSSLICLTVLMFCVSFLTRAESYSIRKKRIADRGDLMISWYHQYFKLIRGEQRFPGLSRRSSVTEFFEFKCDKFCIRLPGKRKIFSNCNTQFNPIGCEFCRSIGNMCGSVKYKKQGRTTRIFT